MIFFSNRKPRGFHHTYIYADSRRELLRQLRERAASAPKTPPAECDAGLIHRAFRRPSRRGQWWMVRGMLMPVTLLLILVLLLFLLLEK